MFRLWWRWAGVLHGLHRGVQHHCQGGFGAHGRAGQRLWGLSYLYTGIAKVAFTTLGCMQCCRSKYIDFGSESGSRILAQFGSGSRFRVMLLILNKMFKKPLEKKN